MHTYAVLKTKHREIRDEQHENLSVRVHRALSWFKRAELSAEQEDQDGQFIFLWIAFNAAYSCETGTYRLMEQEVYNQFLNKLYDLDKETLLDKLVWDNFTTSIRVLLDNKFVFQPFWDFQNEIIKESEWLERFDKAKVVANKALGSGNTPHVLAIVLTRLYTLRNQLIHGGATWNSAVNRAQIRDCANILNHLVPVTISIMMENPDSLWGDPCYPAIK